MIPQVNRDRIDEVFSAVYDAFNINLGFCNSRGDNLGYSTYRGRAPLCTYLRKDPFFNNRCVKSDERICAYCESTGQPCHCRCHVGFEEYFYPVFIGKTLLGFIVTGQFYSRENREEVTRNILEVVRPDAEKEAEILRLLDQQPQFEKKKTKALFKLLDMAINDLLRDDVILIEDKRLSDQIDGYIQQNLAGELCTDAICDAFSISKAKLNRVANDFFGDSIQRHVRKRRIDQSIHLLENSEVPISEIAAEVGIPDYNYFTKVFRGAMGCAPKEWRKRSRLAGAPMGEAVELRENEQADA